MKHIKHYEEIIDDASIPLPQRYGYKIGEYVKVINIPKSIYQIKAINTEDIHQPYLLIDAKKANLPSWTSYWMSGNLLTYATKEEIDDFNMTIDQNKYNL